MEVARSEHPASVLGGEVVVLGGFIQRGLGRIDVTASVEAYSPEDDTWQALPDLPEPRHHGMAAQAGGRLFVMGGFDPAGAPTDTVWELVDGAWVDRAPLPNPVASGAAVAHGEAIFVIGGVPGGGFSRYELATDSWVSLAGPSQREHLAAAVFEGEVWAIAGRWQGEIFDTVEIYDPGQGAWRPGPKLTEARSGFGAVAVGGGIVVAGGEVFDPNRALQSTERFAPDAETWTMIEPLPHGLHGNPLVAIGNHVYLPGGSTRAADVENDGRTWRLSVGDPP
jgi:N-acetylneuraminic acid mutarotase